MKKKVKINIPLNTFNDIYLEEKIMEAKERYILIYGGAGSGKSFFITQWILKRILMEKNHRILVCRKVANTLRKSVFQLFKDLIFQWGLEKLFTINKSEMIITCVNNNQLLFVGLDDVEKLKSIAGITSIWIEEASECNSSDLFQLDLRLRNNTKNTKQVILSFNPISETNWLKREFFDKDVEDSRILKTTYLDNKFIDDDYKKMIEDLKKKDEIFYNVYALGNWGVLGNVIYSNYTVKEISTDPKDYDVVYTGLDFGFNDPSAMVRVGVKDDELYIIDELYQTELTNPELIEIVKLKLKLNDWLVCDSAEADRIKEFKKAGFTKARGAKKGAGSIKFGIDLIRSHKVYISPACTNFIREIKSYQYLKDKDGVIHDEPDQNCEDHLMDAFRYAMELKKNKKQIKAGLSLY